MTERSELRTEEVSQNFRLVSCLPSIVALTILYPAARPTACQLLQGNMENAMMLLYGIPRRLDLCFSSAARHPQETRKGLVACRSDHGIFLRQSCKHDRLRGKPVFPSLEPAVVLHPTEDALDPDRDSERGPSAFLRACPPR